MINIEDKSKCCGCYACYSICPKHAIDMKEDEEGFKYPVIDKSKCINCGLCEKVCPIINNRNIENAPIAYACYNNDNNVRMQSSSGGIFTLIATNVINKGGVVFGAKWKRNYDNVEHDYVEKVEELDRFRGAKYLQSDINNSYKKAKEFLDNDRYVLFSGTPCQIEGLKSYLMKDYDKLILQDIICHGVPSPKAWKAYKKFMQKQNAESNISKMEFRNKDKEGWNKYHVKITFDNGNVYDNEHSKDIYMKTFLSNISLRESCTTCKFKKEHRISDITLADFWGINTVVPEMNDEKGTSLVLINSEKGEKLFSEIVEQVSFKKVEFQDAIKYNPSMNHISEKNKKSKEFFEELDDLKYDDLTKKYVREKTLIMKVLKKIKHVIKK